jgi:hypothetical protein
VSIEQNIVYDAFDIDVFVSNGGLAEATCQTPSKVRSSAESQTTLTTIDSTLVQQPDKPIGSTSAIRRPTVIPTPSSTTISTLLPKNVMTKTNMTPSSNVTRSPQTTAMSNSTSSIPDVSVSPASAPVKRPVIPTRSISNVSQSPVTSNLRSSAGNSQTTTSTISSATSNSIPRSAGGGGGIPRLTKTSHQIVKPTSTSNTTGSSKRAGQVTIDTFRSSLLFT